MAQITPFSTSDRPTECTHLFRAFLAAFQDCAWMDEASVSFTIDFVFYGLFSVLFPSPPDA